MVADALYLWLYRRVRPSSESGTAADSALALMVPCVRCVVAQRRHARPGDGWLQRPSTLLKPALVRHPPRLTAIARRVSTSPLLHSPTHRRCAFNSRTNAHSHISQCSTVLLLHRHRSAHSHGAAPAPSPCCRWDCGWRMNQLREAYTTQLAQNPNGYNEYTSSRLTQCLHSPHCIRALFSSTLLTVACAHCVVCGTGTSSAATTGRRTYLTSSSPSCATPTAAPPARCMRPFCERMGARTRRHPWCTTTDAASVRFEKPRTERADVAWREGGTSKVRPSP
jgi:hypothetical protein